jgi:hypothetical protein
VLQRRDGPLPVEEIRDLLGIVRSIYRAEKAARAHPQELAKIERVGKLLKNALDLASSAPGTMGHRAAWENAEEGARRVADLVSCIDSAEPIVKAAVNRVRRSR